MEEEIIIENSRGLNLASILEKPSDDGIFPVVILLHGFTGYKEEKHISGIARDLEREGIASIRFDASGFGESGGTTQDDYRVSNYLQDIEDVYKYLRELPYIDASHIGIWGHSMGAMLAIIYSARHNEIQAVCSVSSPIQMGTTDFLGSIIGEWKTSGWFTKFSSRDGTEIKIPYAFIEDAQKYNTLKYVTKLHKPLLIVVNKNDNMISSADTIRIYQEAHQPKELVEIEGIGHDYKDFPDQIKEVNTKAVDFFTPILLGRSS